MNEENDKRAGRRPRITRDRVNTYRKEGEERPRAPWRSNDRSYGDRRPRRDDGDSPRYGGDRTNETRTPGEHSGYASQNRSYRDRDSYGEGRPRRFESSDRHYGSDERRSGGYGRPMSDRRDGFRGRDTQRSNRAGDTYRKPYSPHDKYSQKKQIQYKEEHFDPNEPIRLNKYLANAGVCSRRDADRYIAAGVVTVNDKIVTELGTKVLRSDVVKFHDDPVKIEKKVYVLLNKPKDYVTTSDDPQKRKTVMELVSGACRERIYPVGRLDRNTTGMLLLTNDGDLASQLTHPKFLKKKIYHVYCDRNVSTGDMQQILDGVNLEDGLVRADAIDYASPTDKKQVGIEIHSGKNRIVRRIFESLGYKVVKLDRVYFAGLTKKNLRRGDWRFLTEQEVNMLRMGAFE